VFVAVANGPLTFQRTLMPRGTRDQGIVTGLSTAVHYGVAALIQDSIEALALQAAGERADPRRVRHLTLAADALAVAGGLALERSLRRRPDETLSRAAVRTAGHWLSVASFAGLAVGVIQELAGHEDDAGLPMVGLPAGAALATVLAFRRRRLEQAEAGAGVASGAEAGAGVGAASGAGAGAGAEGGTGAERPRVSAAKALGIGAGVGTFVAALATVERWLASVASRSLGSVLPGDAALWRPAGHLWALSALGIPFYALLRRSYGRIEAGAERIEPGYDAAPASSAVSGGPGSLVPWETLGKQGRRNVSTVLRPAWIEAVMGEPATAEPIRVYVGLESASTERARVDLAVEELARTGAFDRPLLMVVSPTGTGYVSYVAVEAAEYLTLGNMASVTLQYSLRPSVLSLDRVAVGRRHHRLLLEALQAALGDRPAARRPRVVLFGESLGAWSSQSAFEGQGTRGLLDLGVDRALWAGVPLMSRWRKEVLGGHAAPAVDPSVVGVFDDVAELRALDPAARSKVRYVMIAHHDDPVPRFGPPLLVQAPEWLGPPERRPPGVPRSETWQTPTTFLQTLVDIKNSVDLSPGHIEARGHDYRGDLAAFVREVYALPASDEQLARVEDALRRFEDARAAWIRGHAQEPGGATAPGA
jgi:uncharacterized membrane protein